ncbi:MAG: PD-(D/E)XK nuclease family protein [Pseudomonadota bacterium]
MHAKRLNLWTIRAGEPFAASLVSGLVSRFGDDPLGLADCLVLLPNRRAVRTVQTQFLRAFDAKASILPRLSVLGDDPDQGLEEASFALSSDALKPIIDPMTRLKLLAKLIDAWQAGKDPKPAATPAHVARLAASLARFLDQSHTEGLTFSALADLVPEEFAVHWQDILDFLQIVTTHWPRILKDLGQSDQSLARRMRLEGLLGRWQETPPAYPVVAAGSTGSIPATAALLDHIAHMPNGHVVLPPLDQHCTERCWEAIGESHHQGAIKRLLERMNAARQDVEVWHEGMERSNITERVRAISAAMSPAETFHEKIGSEEPAQSVGRDIQILEADNDQEEACAIALILRQTLETPGQTAALITPDRALARRVASILLRWDIRIDDSAGVPLAQTPPARFVLLLAQALASDMAPAPLLALLKHPYFACGRPRAHVLGAARHLDKQVLRGVRFAGGLSALRERVEDGEAKQLLSDLDDALAPWPTQPSPAEVMIKTLITCAAALANGPDSPELLSGEDGNALATWADSACQPSAGFEAVEPDIIAPLLEALMDGAVVRSSKPAHPRLAILGTIEARMVQPDIAVLGGLNDGSWPPAPQTDPWMNEPMRVAYGLPPHDRRIGLSALDFFQGCSAGKVYLTRTTKKDGAPTLPSRWISRLKAAYGAALQPKQNILAWARSLDAPDRYQPWPQPRPAPPVALRPRDLSVSDVERWLRDPYALYAKHVLKLKPLDMLDQPPGAADKGSTIHEALEVFFAQNPTSLTADAFDQLMETGANTFQKWRSQPGIYALWWPRFADLAAWIIDEQRALLAQGRSIAGVETNGKLPIAASKQTGSVRAKADRIDIVGDDVIIIDYKTGSVPDKAAVLQGYAPQLAIEGLIAARSGFDVAGHHVSKLEYWGLSTTGRTPPKRHDRFDAQTLIDQAEEGLHALFAAFGDPKTPYLHAPAPEFAPYRDFDDLARPEEWRDVPEAKTP